MNTKNFNYDNITMQGMMMLNKLCEEHFECKGCTLKDGKIFEPTEGVKLSCQH